MSRICSPASLMKRAREEICIPTSLFDVALRPTSQSWRLTIQTAHWKKSKPRSCAVVAEVRYDSPHFWSDIRFGGM